MRPAVRDGRPVIAFRPPADIAFRPPADID
jgi:hypothetical protein